MDKRAKQHHDRRMERLRLQRIRRRKRRAVIMLELLLLGGLFYVTYEMYDSGKFEITDITNVDTMDNLSKNVYDVE